MDGVIEYTNATAGVTMRIQEVLDTPTPYVDDNGNTGYYGTH